MMNTTVITAATYSTNLRHSGIDCRLTANSLYINGVTVKIYIATYEWFLSSKVSVIQS